MFRLHKHNKPLKLGEKIDFKFSNFQALQVPKGWDKLFVSLISVETGKTIAKSSKALVRSGNCQWTETLSESFWISQDDSSKDLEYLFKLVVSMGSARSGILGEATVNMAQFMTSTASAAVSLPLKKCSYGTTLQVKIHCLTPRTKLRDEQSKYSNSRAQNLDADCHDVGSKSNGSGDSSDRSLRSQSSQDLDSSSYPGKIGSMETSYSASGSNHNLNSADGSMGGENFFLRNDLNGHRYNGGGRRDAASSENSSAHGQSSSPVIATSSLTNAGSSKNLLEATEDSIEEIRNEAKMWERNSRKLTLDLDILRKKLSDQSKKQTDLEMELSAASTERDGVKKEVEQLKLLLEESMVKQTDNDDDSIYQSEGAIRIQQELENEIKFQQELNVNLTLQLQRNQESNIELVSVLQELEETIEKQKLEIENLSMAQSKFNDLEKSIQGNLEENRSLLLQLQQLQESDKSLQVNVKLLEQALEEKNNELENERSLNSQSLLDIEREYKCKFSIKEEEIVSLEEKLAELERDCCELTDENLELLWKLKETKNNNMRGSASFDSSSSEIPAKSFASTESEVKELKSQIYHLEEELKKTVVKEDQLAAFKTSKLSSELFIHLETAFHHVKRPWYNISSDVNNQHKPYLDKLVNQNKTDTTASEVCAESIINCFIELNKLLEARNTECDKVLRSGDLKIQDRNSTIAEAQKQLEYYILKVQELESSNINLEANLTDLGREMTEKRSEVEKLKDNMLSREKEIDFLRQCQMELEVQLFDLTKEKGQLQENLEIALRESNENLARKSSELETGKRELELHLFQVEEENVQLSEHISGLEDQLKYVTGESESSRLEIENSKSVAMGLQDEIRRLAIEMETEKVDLQQKLHDMENRHSEAQEECEYLKVANQKLQASADSLVEELSILQKSNEELRKEKLELHEHCTHLETDLRESQVSLSDCSKRIEALEEDLSSMLENFISKEKIHTSELDAILQENRKQKEKHILEETLLNQMYLEKTAEVENLKREVEHLTKKISVTHDERERIASEAVRELSFLRADRAKLESSLQEVHSRVKLIEDELDTVRLESELTVQGLMVELAASRQSHEILMADHDEVLKLSANYRSSEEKLKTAVNDLELKLKVSEYEHQQLFEENVNLKAQLQKLAHLQDEVLALKSKLNVCMFEKEKLEASLHSISGDYEGLKAEKISFLEKISSLQKSMSEFEDCKRKRIVLEEKLLQMEGNLTAKEALCAQDTELRNELGKIKRTNKQYQRKIQQLEEEKDESLKRAQALEEDLRLIEAAKQDQSKSCGKKNKIVKSTNKDLNNRRKASAKTSQTRELLADQQNPHDSQCQREGENEYGSHDVSPHAVGVDHVAKIQVLENELAEALEANNKYKIELQRFLSEGQNSHLTAPRKSMSRVEVVPKEKYERTKSSLETELIDLRDRYFQMSLKYAEVEAQRENLVMMLKAAKSGKRWFS